MKQLVLEPMETAVKPRGKQTAFPKKNSYSKGTTKLHAFQSFQPNSDAKKGVSEPFYFKLP
jgi:hypothetical protein